MNIKTNRRPLASVLMLTLLMAVVVSTALASYLAFVSNQNMSIARSMSWNAAMAIAESGVEEALTQVNLCGYTNYVNENANLWELGTDLWYHKTRSFSDGSYYSVSIHPVDPPVIVSTGFVVAPMSTPTFTAFGLLSGQVMDGSSPTRYVNRTVRIVTTRPLSQGTAGFKAKSLIRFSLNGSLDSYNSALGPYNRLDNAKACTNSKVTGAIQVGVAHIYGSVQTGSGGTVTSSGTGAVGTSEWNDGNSGIQNGKFT